MALSRCILVRVPHQWWRRHCRYNSTAATRIRNRHIYGWHSCRTCGRICTWKFSCCRKTLEMGLPLISILVRNNPRAPPPQIPFQLRSHFSYMNDTNGYFQMGSTTIMCFIFCESHVHQLFSAVKPPNFANKQVTSPCERSMTLDSLRKNSLRVQSAES